MGELLPPQPSISSLARRVAVLREELMAAGRLLDIDAPSALNLVHYLAFRRHDHRDLQIQLSRLGLSSLGRMESHALWQLCRVQEAIHALERVHRGPEADLPGAGPIQSEGIDPDRAAGLLAARSDALLGPATGGRRVRVMVTMPTEAADDPTIIHSLLEAGMNIMRINCAHDDERVWARMIAVLRGAEARLGVRCRVLMDLAGPKVRTGELEPGPRVVRWNPPRDVLGRPSRAALVLLSPAERGVATQQGGTSVPPPPGLDAVVPVDAAFLSVLRPGSVIRFQDVRGRRRLLKVVHLGADGVVCQSRRAAYVVPGTRFECRINNDHHECVIGDLPPVLVPIRLDVGDVVILSRDPSPGRVVQQTPPDAVNAQGPRLIRVPFSLPEIFSDVSPGQRVMIDDGKIRTEVISSSSQGLALRVVHTKPGGANLAADKGVNFPGLNLSVPALTPEDRRNLAFVAEHADMVGLSFVRNPQDVELLASELERLTPDTRPRPGIVLKIETRTAFDNLPDLLLAALRAEPAGVMIARGDLAVECGYERLAEVQEEILWLCEAAHLPVIWATQVLEGLAKKGMPSRSEVTDAAMGERAECVMLNKGAFVVQAVHALNDILQRMGEHQSKKRSMLRRLGVSERYFASREPSA